MWCREYCTQSNYIVEILDNWCIKVKNFISIWPYFWTTSTSYIQWCYSLLSFKNSVALSKQHQLWYTSWLGHHCWVASSQGHRFLWWEQSMMSWCHDIRRCIQNHCVGDGLLVIADDIPDKVPFIGSSKNNWSVMKIERIGLKVKGIDILVSTQSSRYN
jgi:hypothetical protein